MQRAIISSLYRLDTAQLDQPAAPLVSTMSALEARASKLVAMHRLGRTFDLSRLCRELLNVLLDGKLSPVTAALVLHRVLGPMPISARATLALSLTNAIRNDQFSQLAYGSLVALRRALLLEDAEVTSNALLRLDEELAKRGAAMRWHGPLLLVADRVHAGPAQTAALVFGANSDAGRHLVVLVPSDEEQTSREVMFEHVRLQLRCGEDDGLACFLTPGAVQFVAAKTLMRKRSSTESLTRVIRLMTRAVRLKLNRPIRLAFAPLAPSVRARG